VSECVCVCVCVCVYWGDGRVRDVYIYTLGGCQSARGYHERLVYSSISLI
jgi:hypothetical protein